MLHKKFLEYVKEAPATRDRVGKELQRVGFVTGKMALRGKNLFMGIAAMDFVVEDPEANDLPSLERDYIVTTAWQDPQDNYIHEQVVNGFNVVDVAEEGGLLWLPLESNPLINEGDRLVVPPANQLLVYPTLHPAVPAGSLALRPVPLKVSERDYFGPGW